MPVKPFAFVLMPLDAKFDDIYKLGIKKALEETGFISQRVDEQIYPGEGMLERIKNQIDVADLIVADMSGKNANVFYEVGYAHAKKKLCILLTSSTSDIPFDLKHESHIVYKDKVVDLKKDLKKHAKEYKKLMSRQATSITVELTKAEAFLSRTKFEAEVHMSLVFDLYNLTVDNSFEIEAVYFYTGNGWVYSTDQKPCDFARSDVPQYEVRHLAQPPVRRLQKQTGWAQLRLAGTKTVGDALRGEKLENSYRIGGISMLRLIINDKTQDFSFNLDIEAKEQML